MKRLYNILVPKFLRDFDVYLLRNYPVVWRTKAIFVLFYGVVAIPFLFAAGYYYNVDAQNLTVEPIIPIEISYDNYHLWSILLVSLVIVFWAFSQYQLRFPFTKTIHVLLTLALYALCFYILFAFTIPAFRLGMIYRTAYHWIDKEDMKQLEESKIYPNGFVLLEEDSIYKGIPNDTFFQRRERIFDSIWHVEDTLLLYRYTNDVTFWEKWYETHEELDKRDLNCYYYGFILQRSHQSYLSHLSSLSDLLDLMEDKYYREENNQLNKYNPSQLLQSKYSSPRSSLAFKTYRRDWSYKLALSYLAYQSVKKSPPNLTTFSYYMNRSDFLAHNDTWSKLFCTYLQDYEDYKQKHIQHSVIFDKYRFPYINLKERASYYDSLMIHRTPFSTFVENGVYSVKNAQLYFKEKIYTRHWVLILKYTLLLSALFYFIPFLSIRHLFLLFIICLFISIFIVFKIRYPYELNLDLDLGMKINNITYLLLPIASYLILIYSILRKKQVSGLIIAEQGLFLGLVFVLVGVVSIIYRENLEFDSIESYQPPYDLAFYGIQVLGILGAVLTTYVRTLPKQ
jgi:hypothetical protein